MQEQDSMVDDVGAFWAACPGHRLNLTRFQCVLQHILPSPWLRKCPHVALLQVAGRLDGEYM